MPILKAVVDAETLNVGDRLLKLGRAELLPIRWPRILAPARSEAKPSVWVTVMSALPVPAALPAQAQAVRSAPAAAHRARVRLTGR